jgi:hypothetical protein
VIGRRYSPQRLESDVFTDLRSRLHREGEVLSSTGIVGPESFYRALVQCLCPAELVTGELQDVMQRACEEMVRLTAAPHDAEQPTAPDVLQLADAVSFWRNARCICWTCTRLQWTSKGGTTLMQWRW